MPTLSLTDGYNTRQAMSYGFHSWRDFFNDRQLLALGWLISAIREIRNNSFQNALLTLFSGILEFNNLLASYKGEGTGAVRHMFSHHVLKPERTPIEANVWGTPKSSGAFSTLFKTRLLRAIEYRLSPTEITAANGEKNLVCSRPFSGRIEPWPLKGQLLPHAIYLGCGDSATISLPNRCIDFVITDPPFFDNVHYSELADFFYAWQTEEAASTRNPAEVQDENSDHFARKLQNVFKECFRVLKDEGILAFTYHHSRFEGWKAIAEAILGSGFVVINSQPVKSEMSIATPKSATKEPILFDIILVCRKKEFDKDKQPPRVEDAIASARAKISRLEKVDQIFATINGLSSLANY